MTPPQTPKALFPYFLLGDTLYSLFYCFKGGGGNLLGIYGTASFSKQAKVLSCERYRLPAERERKVHLIYDTLMLISWKSTKAVLS